jgi:hypothetical protein
VFSEKIGTRVKVRPEQEDEIPPGLWRAAGPLAGPDP